MIYVLLIIVVSYLKMEVELFDLYLIPLIDTKKDRKPLVHMGLSRSTILEREIKVIIPLRITLLARDKMYYQLS